MRTMTFSRCVYIFSFLVTLFACSDGGQKSNSTAFDQATSQNYFRGVSQVRLQVYYEPGAEPYVGNTPRGRPYWSLLADNLTIIFSYRSSGPAIEVPTELSEMTEVPAQDKATWSVNDVMALNESFRDGLPIADAAQFYIYFLNGNAESGSSVIGFNISGTPVIAIFKEVIEASGGTVVRRFVEQSTLVHEMGHALGFVNSGVPVSQDHQDQEHGAHTINDDCVMYWLNEGASDLAQFVQRFISTGNTIMWGPEVLADAQAFSD